MNLLHQKSFADVALATPWLAVRKARGTDCGGTHFDLNFADDKNQKIRSNASITYLFRQSG